MKLFISVNICLLIHQATNVANKTQFITNIKELHVSAVVCLMF